MEAGFHVGAFQEEKPHCASIYQVSAFFVFAEVPMASANNMTQFRFDLGRDCTRALILAGEIC